MCVRIVHHFRLHSEECRARKSPSNSQTIIGYLGISNRRPLGIVDRELVRHNFGVARQRFDTATASSASISCQHGRVNRPGKEPLAGSKGAFEILWNFGTTGIVFR